MSSLALTPEILHRVLPAEYIARGRKYAEADCVSDLEYFSGEHRYAAKVQGSAVEPYQVEAQLMRGSSGAVVYGLCTCPMRVNCKHVAAMLWKAMQTPARKMTAAASPELASMLRNISTGLHRAPLPASPAAAPRPSTSTPTGLPFELSNWLESAQRVSQTEGKRDKHAAVSPQTLLYVIRDASRPAPPALILSCALVRKLKSGAFSKPASWRNVRQAITVPPRFVSEEDRRIFRMLMIDARELTSGEFALEGETGTQIFRAVLATGRCHWGDTGSASLSEGPPRNGKVTWTIGESGAQRVVFAAQPAAERILPLAPPWYVDATTGQCGVLETGMPAEIGRAHV